MNLIRLFLAIFVLIWHSYYFYGLGVKLPYQLSYLLHLAVPCFFCISGYLITASAIKNDLKTYFKKRIARIYPAYIFSIISIIVLFGPICFALNNNWNFNLMAYIQNANIVPFFINGLIFRLEQVQLGTTLINMPSGIWNGSAWTLIYEFGCYIAIALIIFILMRIIKIKKDKLPILLFALYLFLSFIRFIYIDCNNGLITSVYFLSIFLGGSIIYLIKDKIEFSYAYLFLSIIFCIIIMSLIPYELAMAICAIPMIYIILYISVTLKSPKWIQKNDISYGIYIYAWPIQTVISCFLITYSINLNIYIYMIICLIITSLFSTLSWFLLEKPILEKVR